MSLVTLTRAGFKRVGVLLYTLQQAINGKQDKLPTNGTSGQFLANDLTWKTPANASGGTGIAFNCGFQIGKPFSANFYDNGLFAPTTSGQTLPSLGEVTFPVVFSEDLTINQIGVVAKRSSSDATFKILIYDVMGNGFPKQCVYVSPVLNVTSNAQTYIGATANFTFTKNTVYWVQVQNISNDFFVWCLPSTHTLAFGNSGYFQPSVTATALKANTVVGASAASNSVGSYYNYDINFGTRTYQTHGNAAVINYNLANANVPKILMRAA